MAARAGECLAGCGPGGSHRFRRAKPHSKVVMLLISHGTEDLSRLALVGTVRPRRTGEPDPSAEQRGRIDIEARAPAAVPVTDFWSYNSYNFGILIGPGKPQWETRSDLMEE